MADLTTQQISVAGGAPTFVSATGGGDTAACDGSTVLIVKNGGGSPITVTFDPPGNTSYGVALPDKQYTVEAGTEEWVRMSRDFADPATKRATIAYSGVTSVTVAVVR